MDIEKLYQDYSVKTPDKGHKHHRDGWVQTECPFCSGDPGYHLGYNVQNNYFNCWRCGHIPVPKAISGILGVSYKKAKELIKEYKGGYGIGNRLKREIKAKKRPYKLPANCHTLADYSVARNYMLQRGFSKWDIDRLSIAFNLMRTGVTSVFIMNGKLVNLKFRILAPIYYNGEMVSWQTRDVANRSALKYITCPKESEKRDHKSIIYMHKEANYAALPDYIVLCEGIFDVWKVHLSGFFAGCGFGVDLTIDQIYFLKKNFKRVLLFLDPDRAGIRKGRGLYSQLMFSGVQCTVIENYTDKDPGDLSTKEIQSILEPYFI
jgi:5S rRNA maturation endonuclease (ribonuclease M5)